jgi:hypothetical protein
MKTIDGVLLNLWIDQKISSIQWKLDMGLILPAVGNQGILVLQEIQQIFELKQYKNEKTESH